jgi:transketolase
MRDRFIKTLSEEVEKNPNIILITGDLGFGVLDNFIKKYPNNFINAGVAEQNMTGIAAGLALEGKKVFTYSIANFPTMRCFEQIRNDVCYHNLDVNIVSIGGGFSYGSLGMSHHATEDLAVMRSLPNLKVLSPSGLWETEQATKALAKSKGPGFLRLDKSYGKDFSKDGEKYEIGKARVLSDGEDCALIVTGGILEEAENVKKILKNNNISTKIISMHTVKPLDKNAIIDAVNSSKLIVTLEEHTIYGGLGSAVCEVIVDNQLKTKPLIRIGLEAGFTTVVGSQKYLRNYYKMDSETIVKRILNFFKNN